MSSSRFVPQLPSNGKIQPLSTIPDYAGLVKYLLQPFLESKESLKVDCEISSSRPRVWIRLAFEGEDKGRVFGRGGRNIQAIRTTIEAAASAAGQSVYLDIYGGTTLEHDSGPPSRSGTRTPLPRSSSAPRSSPRLRSR
ncbi:MULTISPECIES: KH domain-containing protein [Aerosakkonema]|uniref:KH domain-containing protein n=1 Tax=Aerosakkonema TaxID=1246629 RepID=UPI0035BB0309